jgi:hypothetical protein
MQFFTTSRTHLSDSGSDGRKYRRDYERRLLISAARRLAGRLHRTGGGISSVHRHSPNDWQYKSLDALAAIPSMRILNPLSQPDESALNIYKHFDTPR